jgi:hypothetical protein
MERENKDTALYATCMHSCPTLTEGETGLKEAGLQHTVRWLKKEHLYFFTGEASTRLQLCHRFQLLHQLVPPLQLVHHTRQALKLGLLSQLSIPGSRGGAQHKYICRNVRREALLAAYIANIVFLSE